MVMGDFDLDHDLSEGLHRAGQSLGKEFSLYQMGELRENLRSAFTQYPDELNERFIAYFTEMAAISESSRQYYGYSSLTVDEIRDFLRRAAEFFDSFTHK